jgi:hypothetical protein
MFLNKLLVALLVATSLFAVSRVHAQIAEVCNAVLTKGIADRYDIYSESQQFSLLQDRACKSNWDSYQAMTSAGASIGLDILGLESLLGLSGDYNQKSSQFRQQYSNFCRSTYESFENKAVFRANIVKVSASLVNGWNRCISTLADSYLKENGIIVGVTPYGQSESFLAEVRVRSVDTKPVVIRAIHPDGKVDCYRGGQKIQFGKTTIDSKDFAMTCYKDPSLEIPFIVEVSTPFASKPVTVPANRSKLEDIAAQMAYLNTELDQLRRRRSTLDCKVASTGPQGPLRNESRQISIPDSDRNQGYFVTGGGCGAYERESVHSPIVTDSRRSDDGQGWFCRTRDPADRPQTNHLNVYVIYCRVQTQ